MNLLVPKMYFWTVKKISLFSIGVRSLEPNNNKSEQHKTFHSLTRNRDIDTVKSGRVVEKIYKN